MASTPLKPDWLVWLISLAGLVAGCASPASLVRLQSPGEVVSQPAVPVASDLPPLPQATGSVPVAPAADPPIAAPLRDVFRPFSDAVASTANGLSSIARNRLRNQAPPPTDNRSQFPDLFDDPLEGSGIPKSERDPFLFAPLMNLIQGDVWRVEDDPNAARDKRLRRQSNIDIRDPDPDTANFPNGAYTLPKGRMYLETSPVGLYGSSKNIPKTYQWEYLMRYGLTDNLEFRIFSNGLTVQNGAKRVIGYSPLAFDFKIHFWEENRKYYIPAMGVEMYIQTPFGSSVFDSGTAPSLNLLFDQRLPLDVGFEYNFGLTGVQNALHQNRYEFNFAWSFQRQVVPDFDVFVQGFYNAAGLPRIPVNLQPLDKQQLKNELVPHPR